jgi:CheY-like chemotaxis protein
MLFSRIDTGFSVTRRSSLAMSVLLADDSEELRRAIRRLLESHSEISLVGSATDFSEAVLFAALLRPDVVVLDLRMKDSQGLDAVEASPQIISMGSTIIAIPFSVDDDESSVPSNWCRKTAGQDDLIHRTDPGDIRIEEMNKTQGRLQLTTPHSARRRSQKPCAE